MGRILRRAPSIAFVLGLVGACAAPTLPLPPPAIPNFSAASVPGEVQLHSMDGAQPFAIILVYNTNPSLPPDERVGGSQADASGSWSAVIHGKVGDMVEISQQDPTTLEWSPQQPAQIQFP